MKRLTVVALMAVLLSMAMVPVMAQDYTPVFEAGECPFPDVQDVSCGTLYVPEDRSDPNSPELELAVAIIAAANGNPAPDPVIYLEGGPGGSVLLAVEDFLEHPMRNNHDLILLDQRGTGFSQPSLNCYEMEEGEDDDPVLACYERLQDEGINLSAYNSVSNAADVNDLRIALGYDQVNLYGISYGTRLALTVLRYHPEGVRSVVIDSVFPPNANIYTDSVETTMGAFNALFSACANDAACNAAYPDLAGTFYDMVDRFNNDPAIFEYDDGFEVFDQELYGDDLAEMLFQALYITEAIPMLPYAITLMAEAEDDFDYADAYDIMSGFWTPETWEAGFVEEPATESVMESDEVLAFIDEFGDTSDSEGMYNSVNCADEHYFDDVDAALATVDNAPAALQEWFYFSIEDGAETCETWVVDPSDPVEAGPVSSDVPVLLISGLFDSGTPPSYGDLAAQSLSNSQHLVFGNGGHGYSGSPGCAADIAAAFVNDPSAPLDTSCMEPLQTVDWYIDN